MLSKQFSKYESEATKLIQEMKEKNPQLEAQQREGRARLWDKEPISLDNMARDKASRVQQQPYVYQSNEH
jgi:hypothetical protein